MLMTLSLWVLGAGLSWDGIPKVNLREEWVVGDGKTEVYQAQRAACVGPLMGAEPGGLEEPREASEAEEKGQ